MRLALFFNYLSSGRLKLLRSSVWLQTGFRGPVKWSEFRGRSIPCIALLVVNNTSRVVAGYFVSEALLLGLLTLLSMSFSQSCLVKVRRVLRIKGIHGLPASLHLFQIFFPLLLNTSIFMISMIGIFVYVPTRKSRL